MKSQPSQRNAEKKTTFLAYSTLSQDISSVQMLTSVNNPEKTSSQISHNVYITCCTEWHDEKNNINHGEEGCLFVVGGQKHIEHYRDFALDDPLNFTV